MPCAAGQRAILERCYRLNRLSTNVHRTLKQIDPGLLPGGLVDITVTPVFAGLEGLDDGMAGGMIVAGGMFIGRTITATHVATDQADPQVHPSISRLQTFFAPFGARGYVLDLVEVCTGH
jgi:hypothetical protein